MSDTQFTPPAPGKDHSGKVLTAVLFSLAIGFPLLALAVVSSDGESSAPVSTNAPAPVITAAPVNKYDQYYEHVLNNSGQANSMAKSRVIEFGDLVCQALDGGNSIAAVVNVVANASGTTSDMELGAAVIYGAITYLCPEYDSMLRAYLSN